MLIQKNSWVNTFLIDDNISKKIVEAINFKKFKKVIEVGPGKGAQNIYFMLKTCLL